MKQSIANNIKASYSQTYQSEAAAEKYDTVILDSSGVGGRQWRVEQEVCRRLLERNVAGLSSAQTLDFACGTGRILAFLRPLVGSLTGADISQAMLDRAASHVKDTRLICVDILKSPELLPDNLDLITSFRFLLLAEPELRTKCIRQLAGRLKMPSGRMVLNTHGNPASFRFLAKMRNKLFRPGAAPLPEFSVSDMRKLEGECGLSIVAVGGCGFIPLSITRILPVGVTIGIERLLSHIPVIWRFATNIIFVLAKQ